MNPLMIRRPGAVAVLLLAGGCAKILGFDEPALVQCVSSSDCPAGFACVGEICECQGECPSGGVGGRGGDTSGGEAGSETPAAGKGPQTGGLGGNDPGTGGTGDAGGDGGVAAVAGRASAEGGSSGSAGEATGGAGDGGAAGAGTMSECGDGASCLVCDDAGKHLPGETPCEVACQGSGECAWPPSCDGLGKICAGEDCCLSLPVLGGDRQRSCDASCWALCVDAGEQPNFPSTVSSFGLDAFEVTVGRFRRFVSQYASAKPMAGAGRNDRNTADTGWNADWDALLPADETALRAALQDPGACEGPILWTDAVGGGEIPDHEAHPMNCVTWFEAQAFCIWDGGRLPTDAEWDFAAGGGGEHRYYPWSQPADSTEINESRAIFRYDSNPPIEPATVGSLVGGRSRWYQFDLAGNVAEWVWDGFRDCYNPPTGCVDCGNPPNGANRVARGGAFHNTKGSVSVETRRDPDATERRPWLGFRCVRDY